MDTETAEALDRLSDRIDAQGESLREEITALNSSLRQEITAVGISLREQIVAGDAETRRHTKMLFESLQDDIRIVAEGVAVLTVKVDRMR
jgi:hypothetical protein